MAGHSSITGSGKRRMPFPSQADVDAAMIPSKASTHTSNPSTSAQTIQPAPPRPSRPVGQKPALAAALQQRKLAEPDMDAKLALKATLAMKSKRAREQAEQREGYSVASPEQACRALDLMKMSHPPSADRLTPFVESDDHYALVQDRNMTELSPGVKLGPQGQRMLADHYRRKYDANIVFLESERNLELESEFAAAMAQHIGPLRESPEDVRRAFMFHFGGYHAVPVIYIKENGREGIVVADSLGTSPLNIGRTLSDQSGLEDITIYRVEEGRQLDHFSCYADAMKFFAIITGHHPNPDGSFGDHLLPNVLEELESRKKEKSAWPGKLVAVRLPDELGKLAQTKKFVDAQRDGISTKEAPLRGDRKGRTLTEYREPYKTTVTWIDKKDPSKTFPRPIDDHLRQKGFQYADIIQIEHYNRQLEAFYGKNEWTPAKQERFVSCLKKIMREAREAAIAADRGPSSPELPRVEGRL
jgi:hypothetical protein